MLNIGATWVFLIEPSETAKAYLLLTRPEIGADRGLGLKAVCKISRLSFG